MSLAVDHTAFARVGAAGYGEFVEAYGGYDVAAWGGYRTLATVRELRWTMFVVGKGAGDDRVAREARHRIACWRGKAGRPWSWSAF